MATVDVDREDSGTRKELQKSADHSSENECAHWLSPSGREIAAWMQWLKAT
jgi:hypothetical protein